MATTPKMSTETSSGKEPMWNHIASESTNLALSLLGSASGSAAATKRLYSAVQKTWAILTKDRGQRPLGYMNQRDLLAGYLATQLVPNALKIFELLRNELPQQFTPQRILDIGSGPLSASIGAAVLYSRSADLHIDALDISRHSLEAGKQVIAAIAPKINVVLHQGSAFGRDKRLPRGRFDLVIMANLLAEIMGRPPLAFKRRYELVLSALQLCEPHGYLVVVEPGTRLGAKTIMQLRDCFVEDGLQIIAPCTGADRCPLLHGNTWCHTSFQASMPSITREVRAQCGLRYEQQHLSYLILGGSALRGRQNGARLVSDRMPSQVGSVRYLCTQQGLESLSWSTRDPPQPEYNSYRGFLLTGPLTGIQEVGKTVGRPQQQSKPPSASSKASSASKAASKASSASKAASKASSASKARQKKERRR